MDTKELKDTLFLTWEGERIYVGDTLLSERGKEGIVEYHLTSPHYSWVCKDDREYVISLKGANEVCSKGGMYTNFHKVVEEKNEPWLLSIVEDCKIKERFKKLYLSEDEHKHQADFVTPTYADMLTWLIDHDVFVSVAPTIVTNSCFRKHDCFTRFKYTVYFLNKVFQRKDEDGFDEWYEALDYALSLAMDELISQLPNNEQ